MNPGDGEQCVVGVEQYRLDGGAGTGRGLNDGDFAGHHLRRAVAR